DLFELKRRVPRITLQQLDVLVCESPNLARQISVELPEPRCSPVPQRSWSVPFRFASRASSLRKSSLPARESSWISRSHLSQSFRRNQRRNCRSPSSGSLVIPVSSSSSLVKAQPPLCPGTTIPPAGT